MANAKSAINGIFMENGCFIFWFNTLEILKSLDIVVAIVSFKTANTAAVTDFVNKGYFFKYSKYLTFKDLFLDDIWLYSQLRLWMIKDLKRFLKGGLLQYIIHQVIAAGPSRSRYSDWNNCWVEGYSRV